MVGEEGKAAVEAGTGELDTEEVLFFRLKRPILVDVQKAIFVSM